MALIEQGVRGAIRYTHRIDPPPLPNVWDPMYANEPAECINYATCHDNLNLWDKICIWADITHRRTDIGYLKRIDKFCNGIILTSQGIPLFQLGDEMLRTKNREHNSYKSPDYINRMDWSLQAVNQDVVNYYQQMIKLRKEHPAFRMKSWEDIDNYIKSHVPADGVLVSEIDGNAVGDIWKKIIVIYNSAPDYKFNLPKGEWKVAMKDGNPPSSSPTIASGTITASGTAITILYQN